MAETRIRREYLVAMENDDFTFQAPVYVKGFLANYARFLRLDPAPLMRRFDAAVGDEPNEARVLAEQNAAWTGVVRVSSAFKPLAVTATALLILTTAALWTKAADRRQDPDRPAVEAQPPPDARGGVGAAEDRPGAGAAEIDRSRDAKTFDVVIAASTARSWVEVEADGRTLFSGMLERGESHTVKAARRVRLVLGFPSGVELTVDGQHLGSPGGDDVLEIALPDDLPALT